MTTIDTDQMRRCANRLGLGYRGVRTIRVPVSCLIDASGKGTCEVLDPTPITVRNQGMINCIAEGLTFSMSDGSSPEGRRGRTRLHFPFRP